MTILLVSVLSLMIGLILLMELIYRIKKYRQNKLCIVNEWPDPIFLDTMPEPSLEGVYVKQVLDIETNPSIDIKYILDDKCINEVEEDIENKRV